MFCIYESKSKVLQYVAAPDAFGEVMDIFNRLSTKSMYDTRLFQAQQYQKFLVLSAFTQWYASSAEQLIHSSQAGIDRKEGHLKLGDHSLFIYLARQVGHEDDQPH